MAVCARVNRIVNSPVPRSYVGYTINNITPISRFVGHESNITLEQDGLENIHR